MEVEQLDLMMLDMLVQREGELLHRFMGANKDWAQVYKRGDSLLLEGHGLVEDMVRYMEEGYATVKFRVGSQDGMNMKRDLRKIEMVRKTVRDRVGVAVDCNQRWDTDSAFRFAKLCEPYNLAWLGEPIHPHDMSGIRRLKDIGVAILTAFGESMRIYYEYETYIEKDVDHAQPSLGGMIRTSDIIRIHDLAREKEVKFTSGERIYPNAIFGCFYSEDEWIEYHEPTGRPVGVYTLLRSEKKNGCFYCQPEFPGNPQRVNIDKLEKDGLMESREVYYSKNW